MDKTQILEGKKTDNLEATSASETTPVEEPADGPIQLNSSPTPIDEQVKDANIDMDEENSKTEMDNAESDQPVVGDNVDTEETEPIEPIEELETEPVEGTITNSTAAPTPTPTTETAPAEELVHEENGVTESPALKTFTQSQVNEMVGTTRLETREKTFRYIYDRYGVNSEEELDELIGNAQRYDSLQEQYDSDKKAWKEQSGQRDAELAGVKEQVALMQSGIDSSRYDDAKFILKGKGLEISLDNIKNELATHPEWQKKENSLNTNEPNQNFAKTGEPKELNSPLEQAEPESKIRVLGNESSPKNEVNEEEDYVLNRMFKV
jgi:hypothetical protein